MGWGRLRGGDLSEGVRAGPGASEVLGTSPGPFVPGQDDAPGCSLGRVCLVSLGAPSSQEERLSPRGAGDTLAPRHPEWRKYGL